MLAFEHQATLSLVIQSYASASGNIEIRGFTKEGPFTLQHVPTNDSLLKTESFGLADIPIMVTMSAPLATIPQGGIYASLSLAINGNIIQELCAGFIYPKRSVSWPSQSGGDQRLGGGAMNLISGGNPAPGAEVSITVAAGEMWKIRAGRFTLVTDANVANRRVHVTFGGIVDCFASIDQVAGATRNYSIAQYGAIPDEEDDNDILISMPSDIWLPAGNTITTTITNRQAGDDFSGINFMLERFFT